MDSKRETKEKRETTSFKIIIFHPSSLRILPPATVGSNHRSHLPLSLPFCFPQEPLFRDGGRAGRRWGKGGIWGHRKREIEVRKRNVKSEVTERKIGIAEGGRRRWSYREIEIRKRMIDLDNAHKSALNMHAATL